MKKIIKYKVLKEDEKVQPKQKVEFDREHYLTQLKMEVGLSDIPTEELDKYKVQLNSPTGRSSSFSVNAKEYIDKELENIEKSIAEFNAAEDEDPAPVVETVSISVEESQEKMLRATIEKSENFWEWVEDVPQLKEVPMPEMPLDKFKYFKTNINAITYHVVLFDNDTRDFVDQYNMVKKHFCTEKEVDRNFLNGNELIINYLQWVNLVSRLEPPKTDVMTYEDISKRMDNVFEGVEGLDLPAGF
jgi:hypothetical protein